MGALEKAVIAYAAGFGIEAAASREARGVYVGGAKLASIGLRIRRGSSYHGLALNVAADLEPFRRINVCGQRGLEVTGLDVLCGMADVGAAARGMIPHLYRELGFAHRDDAAVNAAVNLTADVAADVAADAGAGAAHSAISTSLQAVNSR